MGNAVVQLLLQYPRAGGPTQIVKLLWQLHTKTGVNQAQAGKSTRGQASPDLQLLEQIWVAASSSGAPDDLG